MFSPIALPSGGALHVEGPLDGAPVLLLHGVGGGAWSWAPIRDALARSYRVFTWEARGHGAAARVEDAGFADYLTDAREALDAIGAPAVVVGHSMGGFIALILASESSAVRALALIDPVYDEHNRAHVPALLRPLARALTAPLVRSARRNGPLARRVGRAVFAASFTNRTARETYWPLQAAQIPLEYPRMFAEGIGGVSGLAFRPFARDVRVPVLLLNGRFAPLRAGLRLAGVPFEDERLAGGHYLQLDRPHDVAERLRRFLAKAAQRVIERSDAD